MGVSVAAGSGVEAFGTQLPAHECDGGGVRGCMHALLLLCQNWDGGLGARRFCIRRRLDPLWCRPQIRFSVCCWPNQGPATSDRSSKCLYYPPHVRE